MRVFLEEVCNWTGELSKAGGPPQCGWGPANPVKAWEQKGKGDCICSLPKCLSCNTDLPLVFLVLTTFNSDWYLHLSSPDLRPLNYNIDFPGSPGCRQHTVRLHTVRLHSLHNCQSQELRVNQSINLSIDITVDIYRRYRYRSPRGMKRIQN